MRPLRNRDRSEKYICTAENYRANTRLGDCGEVKSLMEWLMHLSRKDEDYINRFFDDSYTNRDVVDYIFSSWGKRLKEYGH